MPARPGGPKAGPVGTRLKSRNKAVMRGRHHLMSDRLYSAPRADIVKCDQYFRFVPKGDSST